MATIELTSGSIDVLQGRSAIGVIDYTLLGGDTVTVTINGTATVLTEGADWTAGVSNVATSASLATAITGISNVTASAASTVVTINARAGTAGDTLGVVVNGSTTNLVEGVDWTGAAAATDAEAAGNLSVALNNVNGVRSWAADITVFAIAESNTYSLNLTTTDETNLEVHPVIRVWTTDDVTSYAIATSDSTNLVINSIDAQLTSGVIEVRSSNRYRVRLPNGRAATAGDIVTVTVDGAATTLTEGVDWTGAGAADDNTCMENLRVAIAAVVGVGSATRNQDLQTTVIAQPANTVATFNITSDDQTNLPTDSLEPELISSAITIGSDILDAFVKEGGQVYADNALVLLGGDALTPEHVISAPSWSIRDDDKYAQFNLQLRGDTRSYLDSSDTDPGTTCTVDYQIRYAGGTSGVYHTYRQFTGKVRSADTTFDADGSETTTLAIEDLAADLDRIELTVNLLLDALPWGCVIASEGVGTPSEFECNITPTNTDTTVTIQAGSVLVDRSKIGGFGNPSGSGSGRSWPFNGNGGGYNGNSNKSQSIVRINVGQRTLDLRAIIGAGDWNDDANLGPVTVYVANAGNLTATLGGAPPDGVALWSCDRQYLGQILDESRWLDERIITLPAEERTRSGVLRYVLNREGIDITNLTFPGLNDDIVSTSVNTIKKPFLQWIDEYCLGSLWKFRMDRNGNPEFYMSKVKRSPRNADWEYHQNNISRAKVMSPVKGQACADWTARGMKRTNYGLVERQEEKILDTYSEQPDSVGGGSGMGGQKIVWGEYDQKLQHTGRKIVRRTFLGDSPTQVEVLTYAKRNPLNVRGYSIGDVSRTASDSGELGIGYIYGDPPLILTTVVRTNSVYLNRLYRGWERITKKLDNPVQGKAAGVGNGPFTASDIGTTLPWGYRLVDIGGQYFDNPPYYGFRNPEDRLEIAEVTQFRIEPTNNGFVKEEVLETWSNDRIHVQAEVNNAVTFGANHPLNGVGYRTQDTELTKQSTATTQYERIDAENIEITKTDQTWRKPSGGSAHNGKEVGYGGASGGHSQGIKLSGETKEVERKKGTLPTVSALADKVERREVGARCHSATIKAQLDISDKVRNEQYEYLESVEQCERVARMMLGRSTAVSWSLLVSLNPAIKLGDTVRIIFDTRGSRSYDVRGLVTGIAPSLALSPQEDASMMLAIDCDYNDMRTTLATKT